MQILIFGDSITYGAWDKEGGWANRLRRLLDAKRESRLEKLLDSQRGFDPRKDYLVYDLGVSGDITPDLLNRIDFETKNRLREGGTGYLIMIFAVGLNDSAFLANRKSNWVSLKKFAKNLVLLIDSARKYTHKIIFIGPTPVDERRATPVPWNVQVHYRNKDIKEYNDTIKVVCREKHLHFIDILDEFNKMNYKTLLDDGVHPNSLGHKKIFEIIKANLDKERIIKA